MKLSLDWAKLSQVQEPHTVANLGFVLLASAYGDQEPLFSWFVAHGKFLRRVGAWQGLEAKYILNLGKLEPYPGLY